MNFTQLLADIKAAGIGQDEPPRFAITITRQLGGFTKVQTFKSAQISCVSAMAEALDALGIAEDEPGHIFVMVRPCG